jgi:hypothetical protein
VAIAGLIFRLPGTELRACFGDPPGAIAFLEKSSDFLKSVIL